MNLANGVWLVYVLYWLFLLVVVLIFERRANRMEDALRKIDKSCSELRKQLLRKELLDKSEMSEMLIDIYHSLNGIERALNRSGIEK